MAQAAAKAEQVQAAIADKRAALATASAPAPGAPGAPGGGAPGDRAAPMTDEEELEILESAEAAAPPRADEGMSVGGGPGGGGDDGDASSWRDLFKARRCLRAALPACCCCCRSADSLPRRFLRAAEPRPRGSPRSHAAGAHRTPLALNS